MTLIIKDRVKETSTTTGTGALTLAGAITGFRAFSSVCTSPSDTCYYTIQGVDGSGVPTGEWETGLGTYSASNTLTRTTVKDSSNSGSVVTLSAGTKQVFIDANASYLAAISVIAGYINGYTLSNDGGTPNSILDIAVGSAADSTNAVMINGTAFTKSTAGAWAAGTAGNGMGTGLTIANSTWYHVFAIINAGAFDVYFDTSVTAANKPTNTTAFRYIGSFKTDGSAHILAFTQVGQFFYWTTAVKDVSSGGATTATLVTLGSIPLGFTIFPLALFAPIGGFGNITVWSPSRGSGSPPSYSYGGALAGTIETEYLSNTSGQIYYKVDAGSVDIYTPGYRNPHVAAVF